MFVPSDARIIELLAEYTYLRSQDIVPLAELPLRTVNYRLARLRELGYVRSLIPIPKTGDRFLKQIPPAHFLTRAGAAWCITKGMEAHAPERRSNRTLDHDLELSFMHLAWKKALGPRLTDWQQFGLSHDGLEPDAFLTATNTDGTSSHYFIEHERSGTKVERGESTVIGKMRRYLDYAKGEFQKQWELPNFRVIIVLPTVRRIDNLKIEMREKGIANRKFLLTMLPWIMEKPTEEILLDAKDGAIPLVS